MYIHNLFSSKVIKHLRSLKFTNINFARSERKNIYINAHWVSQKSLDIFTHVSWTWATVRVMCRARWWRLQNLSFNKTFPRAAEVSDAHRAFSNFYAVAPAPIIARQNESSPTYARGRWRPYHIWWLWGSNASCNGFSLYELLGLQFCLELSLTSFELMGSNYCYLGSLPDIW